MQNVVIVIPIHNSNPTPWELISFQQCFKILNKYPIVIVSPDGLNLQRYHSIVGSFKTIYIDSKWQSSLLGYNKLKVSRFFYNLFKDYNYMLTYELDAFVFKDELEYWCEKCYDYIGAPWFEGYHEPISNNFIGVGNSGFSLRNIVSSKKILKQYFFKSSEEYRSGKIKLMQAYLKQPFRWLLNQGKENYTIQKYSKLNEDVFFAYSIPQYDINFKIAPAEEALQFSFEVKPEFLYQLNHKSLPMGCHAWWKYNLNFWRPFIESYGYKIK